MSTPTPDLAEAEASFRRLAKLQAEEGRGAQLAVLLAEYARRGTALANIGREEESSYQMGYRHGADETGEDRLDEMRGELCRALGISEDTSWATAVTVAVSLRAARSTPGAPTPTDVVIIPPGFLTEEDAERFAARYAEHQTELAASPGADTPAEPSGTAALLALCDALDRLPAPEGAPGRSVPVEEIRRLLRAQSTSGPQVFNCDQSPHPPAQCPRCEPIGETT